MQFDCCVYRRIFWIWLFCGWFAESLASACSDVKHTWVIQLGGMVARVYDQSVDGVVLFEACLVALKLVKCCCPRENQGAVTYTAAGVAFVVRTINLSLAPTLLDRCETAYRYCSVII